MRKFLLSMALVLLSGATMAQSGDVRLTAEELNAKTEKTAIVIKCTQESSYTTYYNPTGRAELGLNSIVYWVPAGNNEFYITKGDGENDYLQTSNITTFGTQAGAAKFHAVKPTTSGSGVSVFLGANCYENEATGGEYWVRLALTNNEKWFNFNGLKYDTGTGVWTVQNIYEAVTITYNIKYNDVTKLTVKAVGTIGNDFPEIQLPWGVTVTKPGGKVSAEGTFDLEATVSVPFEYADSYANITKWYKMGIRDDNQGPSYLKYDETKAYIPTPGTYDDAEKSNFAWAFIGDPFTGRFEIVNNAAGETKVLSAPSAPTGDKNEAELARMVTKNDATGNTSWVFKNTTHDNAKAGAFYIEHPTVATYAFNRQTYNTELTLCYWNGRDTGSSIWVEELPIGAAAELKALVAEAATLLGQITIGTGVGKYSSSYDNYEAAYTEIVAYSQNIPSAATDADIQEKIEELNAIIASFTLNMPKAGSYIRVAYDYGGTIGKLYMQGETSQNTANKAGVKFTNETGAASIWYYDGTSLISYTKGVCIAETGNTRGLQAIGATQPVTFSACDRATGKYFVKVPDYIHANTADAEHFSDHCPNDNNRCAQHCLILEEVETLPVTVTSAGKATLYAPVALTVPTGVKAYTVAIEGEWAVLTDVGTTIPANTGVVLEAEAETYNFAITTTQATATSALRGSVATTYYTEPGTYYALAQVDGVVGFYKDLFNNSRFQNNSHKAYLYIAAEPAASAASYSFRFGEGTTGIEQITDNREQSTVIYDLTGRRIEAITAPGIYVVNGKKILVK